MRDRHGPRAETELSPITRLACIGHKWYNPHPSTVQHPVLRHAADFSLPLGHTRRPCELYILSTSPVDFCSSKATVPNRLSRNPLGLDYRLRTYGILA